MTTPDPIPAPPAPQPTPGQPPAPPAQPVTLPEDHPLVKTLAAQKSELKELKAAKARLDEIEAAQATDLERAIKKAREEARAETLTEVTRERVLDKIEVAAAGKFADVEDARLRVGRKAADFIAADGTIDAAKIAAEVDAVLERAPHLKAATTRQPPRPDPSQGSSGSGTPSGAEAGRAEARRRFGAPAGHGK